MDKKKVLAFAKKNAMLIVLVLVYIFFGILTNIKGVNSIFAPSSFTQLIDQNAYVYILGAGMLMCMLTGGNIDLSCGSFVCLLGAFGGVFMIVSGMNTGLSILLLMLIGIAYGAILGALIAYVHIPPWIATLAGYLSFRGLGTSILAKNSKTGSLAPFPKDFTGIFYGKIFATEKGTLNLPCFVVGLVAAAIVVATVMMGRAKRLKKGYEADSLATALAKSIAGAAVIVAVMTLLAFDGGIPITLIWVVAIILIFTFITSKTTIGRHFYVVGGNIEAARLSGVNTRKIMFLAYLNMAILTTIASFTVVSRSGSAYADVGKNFEMDAISACVVGGVSASGGAGTVLGMVIGATLIGVINLGMSLVSLDANYQRIIKGIVLLAAVVFDIVSKKRNK